MKNKILLTLAMALIGLFSFSVMAEANPAHRGRHKHVMFRNGHRVIVWHNNYRQCGNQLNARWGNNTICGHLRNIWQGGRCGNAVVRCNHQGCDMFGMTYRNGRCFNDSDRHNNRYHNDRRRGNNGRHGDDGRRNGRGRR